MVAETLPPLSRAMQEVVDRLKAGGVLVKTAPLQWGVAGDASGWRCSVSTVSALVRRGVLEEADGAEPGKLKLSTHQSVSPERIRFEAYLISRERGDGDALGHWLEAERRLLSRGEGCFTK